MDLLALLRAHRLLAIVRGASPDGAVAAVLALAEAGIPLIEVSLSGSGALDVISRVRAELGPDAPLGAGTVLSVQDARAAHRAGADFIVTPAVSDAIPAARELGLPVLAGVMTPTEILQARQLGATAFKVFPATALGGPRYLRDLRGPFPELPLVPVGGVDTASARQYLADGALAVGVGSPLVGDAADGGSIPAMRERALAFHDVTRQALHRQESPR
jgi:2-dehydro-3-deoxyphosphogluconate aldolase/(4S)-4-hydroxy-2-oxoglutarate aldolase